MGAHYTNELVNHINKLNQANIDSGIVSILTNDPDHWAEYGVYSPRTLDAYLDAEASRQTYKEEMC